MHFERGSNYEKAIKYIRQATDNDIRRFAYKEAVALSRRGLDLLERLPATRERAEQELGLRLTLGLPLVATEGFATPDVGIFVFQGSGTVSATRRNTGYLGRSLGTQDILYNARTVRDGERDRRGIFAFG